MTEDMDRIHQAVSGQVLQLANLASHAAEIGVQLAVRRSAEAERSSRAGAADAAQRLRAERELAAAVWARARSSRWLASAGPDELVALWASARAWAPLDTRAARAVEAVARRVADLGVDVDRAVGTLDAGDVAALRSALDDHAAVRDGASDGSDSARAMDGAAGTMAGPDLEKRVLAALRAEWAAPAVAAVNADEAFGALATKLTRLEADGADIGAVLRSLPQAQITGAGIRHPAAFAAWLLDGRAAAGEPVRIAGRGWSRPVAESLTAPTRATAAPSGRAGAVRVSAARTGADPSQR